jgi:hypothetical protein
VAAAAFASAEQFQAAAVRRRASLTDRDSIAKEIALSLRISGGAVQGMVLASFFLCAAVQDSAGHGRYTCWHIYFVKNENDNHSEKFEQEARQDAACDVCGRLYLVFILWLT